MSKKPKAGRGTKAAGRKKSTQTQSERFIEAARAIGVDESGGEFNRAIEKIASVKKIER